MSRATKYWLLLACVVAAGFVVFAPAWFIQPFRAQTETHITVSHALRRVSPWLTIALLIVIAVLVVNLWRGARWWSRSLMVLGFLLATLDAWFARQNHFEWMFRPLPNPAYASIDDAKFVDDADLVLAVERRGQAAAYPVRQLAYHHIVHDTVGGVPIVVTY